MDPGGPGLEGEVIQRQENGKKATHRLGAFPSARCLLKMARVLPSASFLGPQLLTSAQWGKLPDDPRVGEEFSHGPLFLTGTPRLSDCRGTSGTRKQTLSTYCT